MEHFERDEWRIRNNEEIENILGNEDIVIYIKAARLRWIDHVGRMSAERMQKKVIASTFYGKRKRGRPISRWMDEIGKDLWKTGKRNWKMIASDREK